VFHSPALRKDDLQPKGWLARIHRGAAMVAAVLGIGMLAGCATPPTDDPDALAAFEEANDPLEPMNRYFFELNYAADELLLKPLAGWYYVALPNFAQDGVRNALRNLRSPIVLANDLFQGETDRAGITAGRFLVNSTLGLAGLFDVASEMGLDYHAEDFGQTLAVHGVGEGPYLVLPLLGPSNPRDASGLVVDMLFDPLTYVGIFGGVDNIGLGAAVVEGLDTRARNLKTLDEIRKGSLDYYATLRSLYRQRRVDEISNGETPPEGVGPSFDVAPEEQTSERPAPPQVSATAPAAAAASATYVTVPVVAAPAKLAEPRIAASSTFIKEPTGPIPAALDP
jgi:phospholipid-binding lipoprotein MlaA